MSFYIILYTIIFLLFIYTGVSIYKKYQNSSGYFFLVFCFSSALWLLFYSSSFFAFDNLNIIYYISKISFALSIISIYSFVFFINSFETKKQIIFSNQTKIINIFFLLILTYYIATPYIISGMYLDEIRADYYELEGKYYLIHIILSLLFIPFFIISTIKKFKNINFLNKIRLKYILLGAFILIALTLIFQLFLPLYGIWLFEREVGIFFLPFLFLVGYSIHKYDLANISVKIGQIIISALSIFFTIFSINIFKYYYSKFSTEFNDFWGTTNNLSIIDITLGVILFTLINNQLKKIFLGGSEKKNSFYKILSKFKKEVPYITNISDLNTYIGFEFKNYLKIKHTKIVLFKKTDTNSELKKIFTKYSQLKIFINDIVFLEENKYKFDNSKIRKEINDDIYLIFPLFNNKNIVMGYLTIGKKPFQENFYSEDINLLQELKHFFEGHIKYIEIYEKIHDLSVNLDQKVDEQTIEYNQLINKQKEFISYISHEVKGPIASSIFQIDSIIEEVIDDNLDKNNLLEELNILNELLLKTGDLVNKLFSIQQFELTSKSLFIERVHVTKLLQHEVALFQKIHTGITFISEFDESITYVKLDKVQFKQVIDNLINNAIKVINKEEGEISISCKQHKNNLIVEIEDNGKGFSDLDIKKIFDKFTTGKGSSVGLGMGLYLCKTIVELHGGNIQAAFGKKLGGAKIIIKIPLI